MKPMSAEELPSLEQLTDDLWHLARSGSLYKTEQRMRAKIETYSNAIRAEAVAGERAACRQFIDGKCGGWLGKDYRSDALKAFDADVEWRVTAAIRGTPTQESGT